MKKEALNQQGIRRLVGRGLLEKVSATAYRFTGEVDPEKLVEVGRSGGEALERRRKEAEVREAEARKRHPEWEYLPIK